MNVIDWLLDSDPAIRWQVMRDLTDAPPPAVAAERSRMTTEGWGARLLSLQDGDGRRGREVLPPDGDGWPTEESFHVWEQRIADYVESEMGA